MRSETPSLDDWLPESTIRVAHRRASSATPEALWEAARDVRLTDTALLGRLVRWRIPGIPAGISYDELFRHPPFVVLAEDQQVLISGLVGRIWTLRRDYPKLTTPEEFLAWSKRGTARVLFANWVAPSEDGRTVLCSETRVQPIGPQGRLGMTAIRPLVSTFHQLVESDGMDAAVRRAESR